MIEDVLGEDYYRVSFGVWAGFINPTADGFKYSNVVGQRSYDELLEIAYKIHDLNEESK